mmetsp:Transcript_60657/g.69294  ORF Transcript_60657/g.69294 Transcript_60657/m.69294 type:complete len:107 (+) Transcript_60657:251-571(+)
MTNLWGKKRRKVALTHFSLFVEKSRAQVGYTTWYLFLTFCFCHFFFPYCLIKTEGGLRGGFFGTCEAIKQRREYLTYKHPATDTIYNSALGDANVSQGLLSMKVLK